MQPISDMQQLQGKAVLIGTMAQGYGARSHWKLSCKAVVLRNAGSYKIKEHAHLHSSIDVDSLLRPHPQQSACKHLRCPGNLWVRVPATRSAFLRKGACITGAKSGCANFKCQ